MLEYIKVMAVQMVSACLVGYVLVYALYQALSWIVG